MLDLVSSEKEEAIIAWLAASRPVDKLVRLPGDASTRVYYRLFSGPKTYIVMKTDPFPDLGGNLPFLVMQRHLAEAGIAVPAVIEITHDRGYILLEDLSDDTLLRKLQEVSTMEVERHMYQRVLDLLIKMQIEASPKKKAASIEAYRLKFDHEKLMWEMNFTLEHFYDKYLKRAIDPAGRKVIVDGLSEICTTLAAEPTVLAHRDFHSRNLMVTPDQRLVMIDFQDARLGPPQYDLASLLRDSYYQLDEAQVNRLLDYYVARYEALSGTQIDRDHFTYIFDLMSIQRNFKAIGSFASFLNRRGNPTYLKYIGNTFENIRRTLLKYPKYSKLREALFHYYYF